MDPRARARLARIPGDSAGGHRVPAVLAAVGLALAVREAGVYRFRPILLTSLWCPRPDQQPLSGCVGRDVLAGACVPNPGAAGAVPVRVRSRSSAGLRWTRGRLWHPRRQHRPLRTGLGSGDRCKGRRFAARRMYVPGIPVGTAIAGLPPFPRHRTRTPRECPEGSAPEGDRPTVFGTVSRLGWPPERRCPPERSTGETHPRAKRPMNRAKLLYEEEPHPLLIRADHKRRRRIA